MDLKELLNLQEIPGEEKLQELLDAFPSIPPIFVVHIYNSGLIAGKREERARWKKRLGVE